MKRSSQSQFKLTTRPQHPTKQPNPDDRLLNVPYIPHAFAKIVHEPLALIMSHLPAIDRIEFFTALRGEFKHCPAFLRHFRHIVSNLPSVFFEPLDSHILRYFEGDIWQWCCATDISIYLRLFAPTRLKEVAFIPQAALAPEFPEDPHRLVCHFKSAPYGVVCKKCTSKLQTSMERLESLSVFSLYAAEWVKSFLFRPSKKGNPPVYPPTLTDMSVLSTAQHRDRDLSLPTTLTTFYQRTKMLMTLDNDYTPFNRVLPDSLTSLIIPDQSFVVDISKSVVFGNIPSSLQFLTCPLPLDAFSPDASHFPNVALTVLPTRQRNHRTICGSQDDTTHQCQSPDENVLRDNRFVLRRNYAKLSFHDVVDESSFSSLPPATQVLAIKCFGTKRLKFKMSYLTLIPKSVRVILTEGIGIIEQVGDHLLVQPQPHVLFVEDMGQWLIRDMTIIATM